MKHLILLFLHLCAGAIAGAATRPNLVIFLPDDAGWGDCSHSGNKMVATPNIDPIAQGEFPLTFRAIDVPGGSAMDVLRVTLTLLP